MKSYFFNASIFLIVFVNISFAQPGAEGALLIDSLEQVVSTTKGKSKGVALYQLAFAYIFSDLQKAKIAAREGVAIGESLKDTSIIVSNGRMLASSYRRLEMIDSAMLLYDWLIPMARHGKLYDDLRILLNSAAMTLTITAEYDEALELHFESLKMRQDAGDSAGIATTLHNIGHIYYLLDDIDSAMAFTRSGLRIKEKIGFNYDMDLGYANMMLFSVAKKDSISMKRYRSKLDSLCGNACSTSSMLSAFYSQGKHHFLTGDVRMAETLFKRGYAIAKEVGDTKFLLDHAVSLAELYNVKRKFSQAIDILKQADDFACDKEFYNSEWADLYLTISNSYKHQSDVVNAFAYQEKYLKRKEAIFNLKRTRNLMRLDAKFQERENLKILKLQEEMITSEKAVVAKQKTINILLALILIIALVAAMILYKLYQVKSRINKILAEKISQRTSELQQSHDRLKAYQIHQSLALKRAAAEMRSNIASVTGLLSLGESDFHQIKRCLSKIENVASMVDVEI